MEWNTRIDAAIAALNAHPDVEIYVCERGDGASEELVRATEARLGHALDPRFMAFFRAYDGLRLLWGRAGEGDPTQSPELRILELREGWVPCGAIRIPSLEEMFEEPYPNYFNWNGMKVGDVEERVLGGWDSYTIRRRLRILDDFEHVPGESSPNLLGLVADERYPDPVALLTSDHTAELGDHRPIRARRYLELVVATFGMFDARAECLQNMGASGDHPLYDPPDGWLDGFADAEASLARALDDSPDEYEALLKRLRAAA